MDTSIRPMRFDAAAEALLGACHLPAGDLAGACDVLLFGHASKGALAGMVGLEMRGADALLRSLVVAQSRRGSGLGAALVSFAEQQATARGGRQGREGVEFATLHLRFLGSSAATGSAAAGHPRKSNLGWH